MSDARENDFAYLPRELAELLCSIASERPSLYSLVRKEGPFVMMKVARLEQLGLVVKLGDGTIILTAPGLVVERHLRTISNILGRAGR